MTERSSGTPAEDRSTSVYHMAFTMPSTLQRSLLAPGRAVREALGILREYFPTPGRDVQKVFGSRHKLYSVLYHGLCKILNFIKIQLGKNLRPKLKRLVLSFMLKRPHIFVGQTNLVRLIFFKLKTVAYHVKLAMNVIVVVLLLSSLSSNTK